MVLPQVVLQYIKKSFEGVHWGAKIYWISSATLFNSTTFTTLTCMYLWNIGQPAWPLVLQKSPHPQELENEIHEIDILFLEVTVFPYIPKNTWIVYLFIWVLIVHIFKEYILRITQCAERILNRISKAVNKTFAGLKCMPKELRIYFVWNPRIEGMESIT